VPCLWGCTEVMADWPLPFMDQNTVHKHCTKEELADNDAHCMLEGKEVHIRKLRQLAENCQKATAVAQLPFKFTEMRKPHIHFVHLKRSSLWTLVIHFCQCRGACFCKSGSQKACCIREVVCQQQQIQSRVQVQTCKWLANDLENNIVLSMQKLFKVVL